MQTQQWLECKAEKGMLSGELAVTVNTESGVVSLFASQEDVREVGGRSRVRVKVIDENQSFRLVELPQPPVDGAPVVKVKRSLVTP